MNAPCDSRTDADNVAFLNRLALRRSPVADFVEILTLRRDAGRNEDAVPRRRGFVLTGPNVILALKIAVAAVTVLLIAAIVAVARGHYRLHGRINLLFFTLTLMAVLGLELVVRILAPDVFA
jgi:hypothetical protein